MSQPKFQLETFRAWAGKSSDISYYLNSHHIDVCCWINEGKYKTVGTIVIIRSLKEGIFVIGARPYLIQSPFLYSSMQIVQDQYALWLWVQLASRNQINMDAHQEQKTQFHFSVKYVIAASKIIIVITFLTCLLLGLILRISAFLCLYYISVVQSRHVLHRNRHVSYECGVQGNCISICCIYS